MSEKVNPELNSQSLDFSIRRSQFSYIIIKEPGQKKKKKAVWKSDWRAAPNLLD